MASPPTHLEDFTNVTSRELWCKHTEQQTDGQVHVPRCRKRFEDFFHQDKQPGQPREAVQQDGPDHAAEQVVSGDQRLQVEQEPQQHASVPEPSAQPSSSSHEELMQVSTTPRRARNPDNENEVRTVRPRLDMNALINELCEREIDWEKLAMDNSSVYDIHTGLKLDEEQVRAGRETEVKRMLEFEVYEEVNEQLARGKRIWNSAWLDSQKRPGTRTSEVETESQSSQRCEKPRRCVCGHTTTCSNAFHFVPCCIAWSWQLSRLVGCVGGILPRNDCGRRVCSTAKEHAKG